MVREETVSLDAPLLLLLLLDLQACDLVFDAVLELGDLTGHSLFEDHNVLHQVELHLVALTLQLLNALTGLWLLWTFQVSRH